MLKRPTSAQDIPPSVPVFPLAGALLLPYAHRPLNIFEPRYVEMVDAALRGNRLIGLIQPEDASEESPKGRAPSTAPWKLIRSRDTSQLCAASCIKPRIN